jgi:hypothetical protein
VSFAAQRVRGRSSAARDSGMTERVFVGRSPWIAALHSTIAL